jgi:hypothetical protein
MRLIKDIVSINRLSKPTLKLRSFHAQASRNDCTTVAVKTVSVYAQTAIRRIEPMVFQAQISALG